jgi:uncharacterized protein YecE (DUF72 family)
MAKILVGTSGFSYTEWKGIFYPEDLSSKNYLSYYAQHFKTTEINNTFYKLPSRKLTESWYSMVPEDFAFTLKLTQKITHIKRLKNVDDEMNAFLEGADGLMEKMGPILVQLPPNFKKDTGVLENFLESYAKRGKLACEFRHESWYSNEVYDLLKKYGCAFGVVEAEDSEAVKEVTAPFIYMRLRKGDYTSEELGLWSQWILAQNCNVYCYLKHDEKAPVLAQELIKKLEI